MSGITTTLIFFQNTLLEAKDCLKKDSSSYLPTISKWIIDNAIPRNTQEQALTQ